MVKAKFRIVTCRAKLVNSIDLDIDLARITFDDFDDNDIAAEFAGDVFEAAGIKNYICDGCYDHAYRVECDGYEELVEEPVATDGPNVELYRMVVKARPSTDYTTCVRFTDLDNKVVSLGFDGRYDIDEESDFRKCYSYGIYADCSVIDGEGRQLTKAGDLQTIRNLRDALNKLNLGD